MGARNVKRLVEASCAESALDTKAAGIKADTIAESTSGAKTALSSGATIPTGKTLALTDADSLTVGGKIVPQELVLTFALPLASAAVQNLFVAPWACKVTKIEYANSVAEAKTATVCKAVSTSAPVKTTTPMHTADAYDFNTAAHTKTTLAATATAADRILAAGDRIGLAQSAALTTGCSCLTITIERV